MCRANRQAPPPAHGEHVQPHPSSPRGKRERRKRCCRRADGNGRAVTAESPTATSPRPPTTASASVRAPTVCWTCGLGPQCPHSPVGTLRLPHPGAAAASGPGGGLTGSWPARGGALSQDEGTGTPGPQGLSAPQRGSLKTPLICRALLLCGHSPATPAPLSSEPQRRAPPSPTTCSPTKPAPRPTAPQKHAALSSPASPPLCVSWNTAGPGCPRDKTQVPSQPQAPRGISGHSG